MAAIGHKSELLLLANTFVVSPEVTPDATKFACILSDATTVSSNDEIGDLLITEIRGFDGYTIQTPDFLSASWNAGNDRVEIAPVSLVFTNNGTGTMTYQTVMILRIPNTHSRIVPQAISDTNFDSSTDTITLTGHGYSTGDQVVFQTDSGTLPTTSTGSIVEGTRYYVFNATANTFQLSTDEISAIDLTSNGTGDFYLIDGTVVSIHEIAAFANPINVEVSASVEIIPSPKYQDAV